MPIIPKLKKKKQRSKMALPSIGRDLNIISTNFLILGILLIVLNGLSTRRTLRVLNEGIYSASSIRAKMNSITETMQTEMSRIFQLSLKYAFLCLINPCARIFRMASTTKQKEMMVIMVSKMLFISPFDLPVWSYQL